MWTEHILSGTGPLSSVLYGPGPFYLNRVPCPFCVDQTTFSLCEDRNHSVSYRVWTRHCVDQVQLSTQSLPVSYRAGLFSIEWALFYTKWTCFILHGEQGPILHWVGQLHWVVSFHSAEWVRSTNDRPVLNRKGLFTVQSGVHNWPVTNLTWTISQSGLVPMFHTE